MPNAEETNYVTYTGKSLGQRFQMYVNVNSTQALKPENLPSDKAQRRAAVEAALVETKVYRNVKKGVLASEKDIQAEFGTKDPIKVAETILGKGRLRVKVYVPNPGMDRFIDIAAATVVLIAAYRIGIKYGTDAVVQEFGLMVIVGFIIYGTAVCTRTVGRFLSSRFLSNAPFNDPLSNKTALRQFESQFWQFVVHSSMSVLGVLAYMDGDDVFNDPEKFITLDDWKADFEAEPLTLWLYKAQLAIWIVTLIHLRFFDVRAADYYVMAGHHLTTILVVTLSFGRYWRWGLAVFLVHDISDVVLDIVKMLNMLRIEGPEGFYAAEICYALNLASWFYSRLVLFPVPIIQSGINLFNIRSENYLCHTLNGIFTSGETFTATQESVFREMCLEWNTGHLCIVLLIILFCMHVWWFYLLVRIGVLLIFADDRHAVSTAEYYQENRDDDSDQEEEETKMKTPRKKGGLTQPVRRSARLARRKSGSS